MRNRTRMYVAFIEAACAIEIGLKVFQGVMNLAPLGNSELAELGAVLGIAVVGAVMVTLIREIL